jgi:hypothetical protein
VTLQGPVTDPAGGQPLQQARPGRVPRPLRARVTFAHERDPDRLYTIRDEYLRVGFGKDHTQLLMLAGMERVRVALFDHAGNLLRSETREVPRPTSGARRVAVRDAWLAERGYQSATIEVKRFQLEDGDGIEDFNWWADVFDRPRDPRQGELRQAVDGWLAYGQFVFDFVGDGCWIDRAGEVTDTSPLAP